MITYPVIRQLQKDDQPAEDETLLVVNQPGRYAVKLKSVSEAVDE